MQAFMYCKGVMNLQSTVLMSPHRILPSQWNQIIYLKCSSKPLFKHNCSWYWYYPSTEQNRLVQQTDDAMIFWLKWQKVRVLIFLSRTVPKRMRLIFLAFCSIRVHLVARPVILCVNGMGEMKGGWGGWSKVHRTFRDTQFFFFSISPPQRDCRLFRSPPSQAMTQCQVQGESTRRWEMTAFRMPILGFYKTS